MNMLLETNGAVWVHQQQLEMEKTFKTPAFGFAFMAENLILFFYLLCMTSGPNLKTFSILHFCTLYVST